MGRVLRVIRVPHFLFDEGCLGKIECNAMNEVAFRNAMDFSKTQQPHLGQLSTLLPGSSTKGAPLGSVTRRFKGSYGRIVNPCKRKKNRSQAQGSRQA